MSSTSWIEIDLDAIADNLNTLRALAAPGAEPPAICAVVKKNAYGLGAVQVAHRLARLGVDMLAVYTADEATELVAKAVTLPILLLEPLRSVDRTDMLYRHLVAGRLHLAIHDLDQLNSVNALGHRFGIRVPAQPYLDTGMSRSGLNKAQFIEVFDRLSELPFVQVTGVFTHFATADEPSGFMDEQMDRFDAAVAAVGDRLPPGARRHAANTQACWRDRRYHLDMIRPGLGLYGYGPESIEGDQRIMDGLQLRPALRWLSRITHVQRYAAGSPVGYGSTCRLSRDSIVGIVPVGYGDGYPLALSNVGILRLHGDGGPADCRVLGRVSMDQITIDLTDVAGSNPADLLGREVEVYSDDPAAPNAPPVLARAIGSHTYELLCRIAPSIPRRHRSPDRPVHVMAARR